MDKILVPVDFSVPSSWGFYYAYEMAESIGAEIIVLHMYLPSSEPTFSLDRLQSDAARRKQEILEHLKSATQRPLAKKESTVKVSYVIDYGSKSNIVEYAKKNEADLIIMGTHGAGNAINKAWGSNTSQVIKNAHCPVLAIPEGTSFHTTQNIAYATNFDSKDIESITQLAIVAAATNSKLHCVHINLFNGEVNEDEGKAFEAQLKKNFKDLPVTFTVWSASKVEDGLEIFL